MSTSPLHSTTSTKPSSPLPPLLPFEQTVESPALTSPDKFSIGNDSDKRKFFDLSKEVEPLEGRVQKRQRTQEDPTSPEKPSSTPQMVAKAAAKMKAEKQDERVEAYGQMLDFVGQGKGDIEAIRVAKENALSKTKRVTGISLFQKLFDQNKGFKEGIEVARGLINTKDPLMMKDGYHLLTSIVKLGRGFDAATAEYPSSSMDVVILSRLNLLKELVKQGQWYQASKIGALSAMRSKNYKVQQSGFSLYAELIKKHQVFSASNRVPELALASKYVEVRDQGYLLLAEFVRSDREIEQATKAALKGAEDEERVGTIVCLLSLYTQLLGKAKFSSDQTLSFAEKAFAKRKEKEIEAPLISFLRKLVKEQGTSAQVKKMVEEFGRVDYSSKTQFNYLKQEVGVRKGSTKGSASAFKKWADK